MDSKSWVLVIGAISSAVIAVLVSLYDLGPSAPGVVLGLLLAVAMMIINGILLQQLDQLRKEGLRREDEHTVRLREHAAALQTIAHDNVVAINAVTDVLSDMAKRDSLAQVLSLISDEKKASNLTAAAAIAAAKVADAAVIAAKVVTDTAVSVAKEMRNEQSIR